MSDGIDNDNRINSDDDDDYELMIEEDHVWMDTFYLYNGYNDSDDDTSDDDSMMDLDNLCNAIYYGYSTGVIRRIVANDPNQLKEWNDLGELPLHVVLKNISFNSDKLLQIIRLFVKQYPEAIREKDKSTDGLGNLPIHIAAGAWSENRDASASGNQIIRFLIKQFPEGAREKNDFGELPLHIMARCMHQETATASSSCIRFLIQQYPEGLGEKNLDEHLPLHNAVLCACGKQSVKIIRMFIKAYPQALREKDNDGLLPLHCATDIDDSSIAMTTFRLLVKHYPEGLRVKDNQGGLTLHNALKSPFVDYYRIQFLVKLYPESVRDKNLDGYLPLHVAAFNPRASADIVFFLTKKYAQGLREQDCNGLLPLHCVFHSLVLNEVNERRTQDILSFLVQQYPASVQVADQNGYLPLHHAVSASYASVNVIQYLIQAFPQGVREKTTVTTTFKKTSDDADDNCCYGCLPLHLAVCTNNRHSMDIIRLLVEAFPDSVQVTDRGGYLPLHRAIMTRTHNGTMHLKVIQYLMQQFPQVVRAKTLDHHGYLPLHLAVMTALQDNLPPSKTFYLTLFQYLVDQHPEGLQEPANVATKDGPLLQALPVFLAATTRAATESLVQLEMIFVCILQYPNFLI